MIVTKGPGIVLEKIKHNMISILTGLVGKNDFRICKHTNFYGSGRNEDLNGFSFCFVEIPHTFTLKESSL